MTTKPLTDPKNIIDATTNALEDVVTKAQQQYITMVEQSQAAALGIFGTFVETVSKIDVPSIPGLDSSLPEVDAAKITASAFDFASTVLENQREFANKVLAVSSKA